ncbi:hypothetical protein K7X08_011156 [Anisodus acutangulus]|uniref:Uncharacterized protein n=1 Tax=Anisodus acutangulus TaxID=402998 RepID=A0A9Q1LY72_9SOLA|nr:hypothetical protein K7X08_011156 [Anisodus acutangulus]
MDTKSLEVLNRVGEKGTIINVISPTRAVEAFNVEMGEAADMGRPPDPIDDSTSTILRSGKAINKMESNTKVTNSPENLSKQVEEQSSNSAMVLEPRTEPPGDTNEEDDYKHYEIDSKEEDEKNTEMEDLEGNDILLVNDGGDDEYSHTSFNGSSDTYLDSKDEELNMLSLTEIEEEINTPDQGKEDDELNISDQEEYEDQGEKMMKME